MQLASAWGLGLLCLLCACSCGERRIADPLPGFPRLILWAWERPENLTFIVPRSTGVAYLAGSIRLGGYTFESHPRLQPLFIPPATPVIAVLRIETQNHDLPPASDVRDKIVQLTQRAQVRAVQIDFDAQPWARDFYRRLMRELREAIPQKLPLEMTALVSWCEGDDWIRGMPVADAVPMFFRMGLDPHSPQEKLREPLCRSSLGMSTDEFQWNVPRGRRVYVFSRRLWTESSYRAILQASRRWLTE